MDVNWKHRRILLLGDWKTLLTTNRRRNISRAEFTKRSFTNYYTMRSKSPEKRCRQKLKPRIEDVNPETVLEYFLISVNILEARKLAWSNPQSLNSYVVLILGKEKHRTSIRKNMAEPLYGEYFLFEWYASIREVQRASLWLAVMEPKCCAPPRLLGESSIDLGAIWAQPHHQVFHKWAQLSLPRETAAGAVGFLKVDISIVCREDIQIMPAMVTQDRHDEDFRFSSTSEQQTANYMITVYGAYGISPGSHIKDDRRYGKLPNTYVKVSFCGLSAKTAVQYRTCSPAYCEQISIVEVFPNICQIIRLEVCSADTCFNKALASTDLRLGLVSHDGENGFVPTFGPCLLHMYGNNTQNSFGTAGEDGPYYKGALLVCLKTVVPYYHQRMRSTSVEPVTPIQIENMWKFENFFLYCSLLEVSMLDRQLIGRHSGVAMTLGEINFGQRYDQDFKQTIEEIKALKLHYTGTLDVIKTSANYGHLDFSSAFPVLQLGCSLPDFRFRIFRNNMISNIVNNLEIAVKHASDRIKYIDFPQSADLVEDLSVAIDEASINILKFLDYVQNVKKASGESQCFTELDQKQITLQKEEMEKIYHQLSKKIKVNSSVNLSQILRTSRDYYTIPKKEIKVLLAEMKTLVQKMKNLIFKSSDGWPDIVIWLLNTNSRVAYYKLPLLEVIHSVISEQCGKNGGKIQTIYLKPLKCPKHMNSLSTSCYCIAGKIEMLLWMGLFSETNLFRSCLPMGFKVKMRDNEMCLKSNTTMLECRAFIYRAKLTPTPDAAQSPSPFIRINALNSVKETKMHKKTLTPLWNQVLKIHSMAFSSHDRLITSPPSVLVEIFDELTDKSELIGRVNIVPVIDDRKSYEYAPKLQWLDIFKGTEKVGQILMSAQLLQVPETLMKSTIYSSVNETLQDTGVRDVITEVDIFEELPACLIPKSTTYKLDVYWWGLRDIEMTRKPCAVLEIDDLTIKSEVITDKKPNSNFPNGRISQIFEAPLNEIYCPPLTIRLYDSSTFGRTLFLGTNVVKNPNKYLVDWIPKYVREVSLKSASIASSTFHRVSENLFVKKSVTSLDYTTDEGRSEAKSETNKAKKKHLWKRLFCSAKSDEEEYILLPLYDKEKEFKSVEKESGPEFHDWWFRFFSSQKDSYENCTTVLGRIKVFESELECQPEYSKFKDWCKTLKLYNGDKTGIPEKDEELQCGYLKAGIAIYAWPPPPDTIAVSPTGAELERGYFEDYPRNDPSKYLVRVYVVRGVNLTPKDFIHKSDPYVVIKCGSKQSGDRSQFVANTVNPVFGKMYEFRCSLPEDYLLTLSLFDHDSVAPDDLIGSTTIDLEDRIYSKHRARVGLSSEYNVSGPAKWRDYLKPSSILEELCAKNHISSPMFPDSSSVIVSGVQYRDSDKSNKTYISASERKENLCLTLLQKWHSLPICGYHLVPEHVETRRLFNPDRPGGDHGKIQMWVDIFPLDVSLYIPMPVDITPRKVEDYELRVTVWAVQGIKIPNTEEKNGVDIFVKALIGSSEQSQYTDIHYHSIYGDGVFNWRMIFNFAYQHAEKRLIRKEKDAFTEFEERVPPVLVLQVIDCDSVDSNDFLASLALDLNSVPRGCKQANQCPFDIEDIPKKINLFSIRTTRGWLPMKKLNRNTGVATYAGLIDLELSLMPKENALLMPVGLGRDPPFPLPDPNRPEIFDSDTKQPWMENCGRSAEYLAIGVLLGVLLFAACYWEVPSMIYDVLAS